MGRTIPGFCPGRRFRPARIPHAVAAEFVGIRSVACGFGPNSDEFGCIALFALSGSLMSTRFSSWPWLPCLLAGALAARIATAVGVQHWVEQTPGRLCLIEGDADGYWRLARHLIRGEDFSLYDPPRYVMRMPGFPLLLAGGMSLFEQNVIWIRVLLAVAGTAACGLVYFLGRELFDPLIGLVACFLAAVSPIFVVFSVLLLSETFFALGLLASLLALIKLIRHENHSAASVSMQRRALVAAIAGILTAVATLIRPTWFLVAPVFAAAYLLAPGNRKPRLVPAALLVVAFVISIAPWAIRNHRITGHFVTTTLWAGPSLYDGLSPQASGASDMTFIETDGLYKQPGMSEYDNDRHYRRLAWDFVRSHPLRAIELAVIKMGRFWNPLPNAEQFGHWTIRLVVGLFEAPVMLLAVVGLWRSRHTVWRWLPAAAPVLYFALVHTVFIGSLRYRLPAEYALLVLTAVGWHCLFQKSKHQGQPA
jgi:4-amino-4-deoxy-L-arabinose transferase-like glycosyltransferase